MEPTPAYHPLARGRPMLENVERSGPLDLDARTWDDLPLDPRFLLDPPAMRAVWALVVQARKVIDMATGREWQRRWFEEHGPFTDEGQPDYMTCHFRDNIDSHTVAVDAEMFRDLIAACHEAALSLEEQGQGL
jgi:hypothetical protein